MQYDRSAAAGSGVRTQPERPRVLDEARGRLRTKHYRLRTEQAYLYWIRRYIQANGRRHPREMGGAEGAGGAQYPEPGAVGAAVPLPRGAGAQAAVDG